MPLLYRLNWFLSNVSSAVAVCITFSIVLLMLTGLRTQKRSVTYGR